ncbi:MAG: pseudouridine synthase [Cardiobacteriaceae bacterium]|nr:pseudouridine synthase [Cardiobacteriaceae bacterium]
MHSLSHFADIPKSPAIAVIHEDDALAVVAKPPGLLVHRSPVDRRAHDFLLQRLRDQLGMRLYPVHRLDRPTSGIMLFAKTPAAARFLAAQFEGGTVRKTYLALARGWPQSQRIDYPLPTLDAVTAKKSGAAQAARSRVRLIARYELPLANVRHPTSRYALVALAPDSGRRHQLRRHLKHIFHPILGDSSYGDLRHNRAFAAWSGVQRLWLHAASLAFVHPDGQRVQHRAAPDKEWQDILYKMQENRYFLPS